MNFVWIYNLKNIPSNTGKCFMLQHETKNSQYNNINMANCDCANYVFNESEDEFEASVFVTILI